MFTFLRFLTFIYSKHIKALRETAYLMKDISIKKLKRNKIIFMENTTMSYDQNSFQHFETLCVLIHLHYSHQ